MSMSWIGIWYETMALMQRQDAEGSAARAAMAKLAGTTLEEFESQLSTTFLYSDPKAAVAATSDSSEMYRTFSVNRVPSAFFGNPA